GPHRGFRSGGSRMACQVPGIAERYEAGKCSREPSCACAGRCAWSGISGSASGKWRFMMFVAILARYFRPSVWSIHSGELRMKLRWTVALFAATTMGAALAQDTTSEKGKLSYAMGYQMGRNITEQKLDIDLTTLTR